LDKGVGFASDYSKPVTVALSRQADLHNLLSTAWWFVGMTRWFWNKKEILIT